ncbi:hypothetical protein V8G54_037401, partial [Vigna mungo]
MSKHYILSRKRFDRIVYNFPHAGFSHDKNSIEMIKKHQYLVMGFLQNAKLMLEKDGEIHVTHKKDPPFITKAGEIGSSTMPHKVNPIDFENSEGNLGLANGITKAGEIGSSTMPHKVNPIDFENSEGIGHSLLAYKSTLQGIGKLQVNEARLSEDLNQCWELLAEAIKT